MAEPTTTPPPATEPSPEAHDAVLNAYRAAKGGAEKIGSEKGWSDAARKMYEENIRPIYLARAVDAFRREERERCQQIVLHEAKHWPATNQEQSPFVKIYAAIRGEQP